MLGGKQSSSGKSEILNDWQTGICNSLYTNREKHEKASGPGTMIIFVFLERRHTGRKKERNNQTNQWDQNQPQSKDQKQGTKDVGKILLWTVLGKI